MPKVSGLTIGKEMNTDNTYYARWKMSSSYTKTLDNYAVHWYYATGNGFWFDGGQSDVKLTNHTYTPPDNAYRLKVVVLPRAKKRKVNGKETAYWKGTSSAKTYYISEAPPSVPAVPKVKIEKYKLTATIENITDERANMIEFSIYCGNKRYRNGTVNIINKRATFSTSISVGEDYRVMARAINKVGKSKLYSGWSEYSESAKTIPGPVTKIGALRALSKTAIYMAWEAAPGATGYEVEYTTDKEYFDTSNEVSSITIKNLHHVEVTGLESGKEYFLRVRATNEVGESGWTKSVSIVIGKAPSAPTTWSSSTTVMTGEKLTLYWIHNSEDGSSERYGDLELYINGMKEPHTIEKPQTEDEKDKTSFFDVDTTPYVEGTKIEWRVRTAGVTKEYGDWSIQRKVDVYAPVTLELDITNADKTPIDMVTGFPFYISALPGPKTQQPIGYSLSIVSNEYYETIDQVGNKKIVSQGDEVYSNYFDIKMVLEAEMSAGNIDLEDGVEYTVNCTVSMNSGLTATVSKTFTVAWSDITYEPELEIGIDTETYTAQLRPYCLAEDGSPITDVLLSIYRREYDGSFTEIATDIDSSISEYVMDPHPALDYARYRVVAISKTTGAVSYYDPPGYPVSGKSAIIQWDEQWYRFDATDSTSEAVDGDELAEPSWTGSMLKLPYNIDVSDNNDPDVVLVDYIGRSHPVSYYGTSLGTSSSWSMEIVKDDAETLYNLRRLAIWMGDVYVREPSGSGYWANVKVSFSQKHSELTIPVTLDIVRVEGGV